MYRKALDGYFLEHERQGRGGRGCRSHGHDGSVNEGAGEQHQHDSPHSDPHSIHGISSGRWFLKIR